MSVSAWRFRHALCNIGLLKHLVALDIDIDCESMDKLILPLITNKSQLKQICIRFPEISSYSMNCLTELNQIEELFIRNIINTRGNILMRDWISKFPILRQISIIDIPITIEELDSIIRKANNLTRAEFKMSNSVMNTFILNGMRSVIDKRPNKLPLQLTLHVNGQNDVTDYEDYMRNQYQSQKVSKTSLHITLTHKGLNFLTFSEL